MLSTLLQSTTADLDTPTAVLLIVVLLIGLFWFLIPCILCGRFTAERGHGQAIGFVLGILFGWIAVLFCALMPYKQNRHSRRRGQHGDHYDDRPRSRRRRRN